MPQKHKKTETMDIKKLLLSHNIFSSKAFRTVLELAKKEKKELYLVGGFLRDLRLGRVKETLDLDFSLKSGSIEFGKRVARSLGAGFVVLDKEHGCCRVVFSEKKIASLTFDFVDFRGKDLKMDLIKRDFTINALAVRLPFEDNQVLDYCGACRDFENKLIRAASSTSFDEDPLRILRAFSLSAILGFKIEPNTMRMIDRKREALKDVAGERVRDELFKIFGTADSRNFIGLLDKHKVLENVIPQIKVMHNVRQGGYHHLDVWGHSLETLKKLEELIGDVVQKNPEIELYLKEVLAADRRRAQLLKLAALLHDIGKPKAHEVKAGKTMFHGHERIGRIISDSVSEKLKLSTRERYCLDTIIFWHLRPGYLADNEVLTKRAVHRYFRDTEDEAASVLLVSIADQRATRGPLATPESRRKHEAVSFSLLKEFFEKKKEEPLVRLVNGNDLIKKLKLEPGPSFSVILDAVEDAQVEGAIKTKAQALSFAAKLSKSLKAVAHSNAKKTKAKKGCK